MKIWFQQIFTGRQSRAKIPRKKLQLQFSQGKKQFQQQVEILEQMVQRTDINNSTSLLGESLLNDVQQFNDIHLVEINEKRLELLADPLIHPVDISQWILYQMYSYTEEIYHYIKTVEVVSL